MVNVSLWINVYMYTGIIMKVCVSIGLTRQMLNKQNMFSTSVDIGVVLTQIVCKFWNDCILFDVFVIKAEHS